MTAAAIIDGFAGPGGWDEGLKLIGRADVLGIEWDTAANETAAAAGHVRMQADLAQIDPMQFAPIEGLIFSPPCQAWSMAGKRGGEADKVHVFEAIRRLARDGHDAPLDDLLAACGDDRSLLIVEPLRWALALRPEWIACEQVPPALEAWRAMEEPLRAAGYSVWAGVLSAEQYGVPQTRKRAFLLASRTRHVEPPRATHQRYVPGEPAQETHTLEGSLLPWVSMAQALGWNAGERSYRNGTHEHRAEREDAEPAPTLHFGERLNTVTWAMRANAQTNAAGREIDEPAPTIKGGHDYNDRQWIAHRPATTVMGDPRVHPPGHKQNASDPVGKYDGRAGENAVRVTIEEALVLQGFRPDYPVAGTKSKAFEQVGNAVPPPMAAAVIRALTE